MMKIIYYIIFFLVILFLNSLPSSAAEYQNDSLAYISMVKKQPLKGYFGIHLVNSIPQKDFYTNLRNAGLGVIFNGGGWLKKSPLALGGTVGFISFKNADEYFDNYISGWFLGNDTVSTDIMEIPVALTLRFQPATNWIRPYFEGALGCNFLITSADYDSYYGNGSSEGKFSAAWIYGLGAGIDFRIINSTYGFGGHMTLNLTCAINYYYGSNVTYYTTDVYNDMSVNFHPFKSKTETTKSLFSGNFKNS